MLWSLTEFDRITGKSLSEALIFASTNPQYDDRLFIELQVQYIKIVVYRNFFDFFELRCKPVSVDIYSH